ncbi:MAG TPA: tetratricopeptide repeat protein [Blastocatellia bacterium]|nr:tetratricopeptide repeat protein [Blastocatellia bacterium]
MREVLISIVSVCMLGSAAPGASDARLLLQAPSAASTSTGSSLVELDRLRVEGFDAIYSLDYKTARERFEEMTRVAPENPAGYVYLANNLWLETLKKTRRLLTTVYTSQSFYEVKTEDRVDVKRDQSFNQFIKQAIAASQARLAKNSSDVEALYYQASAFGLRAAYNTSVKRSFTRAIGDANQSIKLHKQVLKLDPGYIDSYLSIGLYDYVIGSLPLGWRMLARIAGLKGNKQKGIENMERVTTSGRLAQDDARVVLIGIFEKEGQIDKSLALLDELSRKFPRNYLLGVERGTMLYYLGRVDEGGKVFAEVLKDERVIETDLDLVHYSWGLALWNKADYPAALDRFNQVARWPKSEPGLVSLAHLNAGKSLDALGKRQEAIAEYQVVLKRENVFDSHKQANEYSRKAFVGSR